MRYMYEVNRLYEMRLSQINSLPNNFVLNSYILFEVQINYH